MPAGADSRAGYHRERAVPLRQPELCTVARRGQENQAVGGEREAIIARDKGRVQIGGPPAHNSPVRLPFRLALPRTGTDGEGNNAEHALHLESFAHLSNRLGNGATRLIRLVAECVRCSRSAMRDKVLQTAVQRGARAGNAEAGGAGAGSAAGDALHTCPTVWGTGQHG